MEKVSIGIPCYGTQEPKWWGNLLRLVYYSSKTVEMGEPIIAETMATDHNRNSIVETFLQSKSDWLFWIDADTTIPTGGLERLIGNHKSMISGVYYMKHPPHNPVAYVTHNGGFRPIGGKDSSWERGEILEIDMCGMGCMLTHRSVFEDMKKLYIPKQEIGGGIILVHKDDFIDGEDDEFADKVVGDTYHRKLIEPTIDNYKFPFFSLEHGKTEDLWFCEKAKRIGYQIYLDTGVECGHVAAKEITGASYRQIYGY